FAAAARNRIVCAYVEGGLGRLAVIDLATGALHPLETPFTQFASVRAHGDQAAFIAGAPDHPTSVVVVDLRSSQYRILKKATEILDQTERRIADYLAPVDAIEFPTVSDRSPRLWVVLLTPQARLRCPRGQRGAAAVQLSRRSGLSGVFGAKSRKPISAQPRQRSPRRKLRREHRLRPRVPRPPARSVGRR